MLVHAIDEHSPLLEAVEQLGALAVHQVVGKLVRFLDRIFRQTV
jgi:hypothetical protein